jgi:hypothetical protein
MRYHPDHQLGPDDMDPVACSERTRLILRAYSTLRNDVKRKVLGVILVCIRCDLSVFGTRLGWKRRKRGDGGGGGLVDLNLIFKVLNPPPSCFAGV